MVDLGENEQQNRASINMKKEILGEMTPYL